MSDNVHVEGTPARKPLGEALDGAKFGSLHRKFWLLAALGIMLDGFDFFIIGVANPLIAKDFGASAAQTGIVSAAAILGAVVGAGLLGPLGDKIGRRRIFKFDLIMFVVFSVLCIFAWDIWSLVAFRFMLGIAIGLDYPIAASYLAEILPSKGRGRWLVGGFAMQAVGILLGAVVGVVVLNLLPEVDSWRWMLGFGVVPALIIIVLCVFKSEATTAILVTGLAMAVPVAVWLAQRHPSAAVLSVWAVVTGLAALFLIVTILAPLVFQLLGKAPTLTGRTDIWRALAEPIAQRPWFGWGYQAFWTDTSLTSPVDRVESMMEGFRPPDAHSTPIDIRLQLGLVGLILVGLTFARTWLQILLQAGRQPAMMPAVGIFTAITAMAFTESIGLYPMDGMTLIVQLVVVKTALSAWDRRNSTPNKSQLG
jgi:MFS family permease